MAITINGSGTITGISAGGLPDGSVTAADLASGAITSGALPSGSVLQVVSTSTAPGHVSTTSNSYVNSGAYAEITPSSTSSKVLVIVNVGMALSSGEPVIMSVTRNNTEITGALYPVFNRMNGSTDWMYHSESFSYLDSPASTSALTYRHVFKTADALGTVYGIHSGGLITMTLMEIAG